MQFGGRRFWLVAAPVLALALAPAANASSVSIGTGNNQTFASYQAADLETNVITVSTSGTDVTFQDPTYNMSEAEADCTGNGTHTVVCHNINGGFSAQLGDMNDQVTVLTQAVHGEINGDAGNDKVFANGEVDRIHGGLGNDELHGGGGNDEIDGNGESDTGQDDDILDGGEGNDQFETGVPPGGDTPGPGGSDTITGGNGDDTLGPPVTGYTPAPNGPDDFSGGAGNDAVLDYSERTSAVSVTEDGVANDGQAGEGDNIRGDVETVIGGLANDTLVGAAIANTLDGGAGDDVVQGGGGNDRIEGGIGDAGSDSLGGGDGNDVITGGPGDDGLDGGTGFDNLDGGGGTDTLTGGGDADSLSGGAGIDSLAGGDGNDTLRGGAAGLVGADGGDTLKGEGGNDNLSGEDGDDTLNGGPGADAIGGGAGTDTADYSDRFERIRVTFDGKADDGADGEGDNVASDVENVRGGGFDDDLIGDGRSNGLSGGDGEDYQDGGNGNDNIDGGSKGDVLRARDAVADRVTCGSGPDFVIADSHDSVAGDCDNVDTGRVKKAKLGKTARVGPVKGKLGFSPTKIKRIVPLQDVLNLPLGSSVDARGGTVRLTSAKSAKGQQSATVAAGIFSVLQKRSKHPTTEMRLKGGSFKGCSKASKSGDVVAARKRVVRRLRTRAHGRFRTRGRYSAATVRGTEYTVEDRCDGTLTRVKRGVVLVRDFKRKKNVRVRAGKSYLAKAR